MTMVIQQMFSRISNALKKADAKTLEDLRNLITSRYTPNLTTVYVDNIFDIKSWIRPYVSTLQHHRTPHVFRFTKNAKGEGEVEMVYRLLAAGESKMWLPDQPFIIMKELPSGHPSLLKPDNKINPTPEQMEGSVKHLNARLTGTDRVVGKFYWQRERQKGNLGGYG